MKDGVKDIDAVNMGQLRGVMSEVFDVYVDKSDGIQQLGEKLSIIGAALKFAQVIILVLLIWHAIPIY